MILFINLWQFLRLLLSSCLEPKLENPLLLLINFFLKVIFQSFCNSRYRKILSLLMLSYSVGSSHRICMAFHQPKITFSFYLIRSSLKSKIIISKSYPLCQKKFKTKTWSNHEYCNLATGKLSVHGSRFIKLCSSSYSPGWSLCL